MKTIKILLCIAGFALTGICSGQVLSQNNSDVVFYTAHYNLPGNRMEYRVNQYPARATSGDFFEAPEENLTYFVPVEFDMNIESWMETPFESNFYEEEVLIESWMKTPFESSVYEEEVLIESWMETPFESSVYEKAVRIESWMESPFESNYYEDDTPLEAWMTTPWL